MPTDPWQMCAGSQVLLHINANNFMTIKSATVRHERAMTNRDRSTGFFKFAAIAVLAIGLAAPARVSAYGPVDIGRDPYDTRLIDVTIGDGYQIPRNYLRKINTSANDGRQTMAIMDVLWPGLEPRTPENERYRKRRHPKKWVTIHINDQPAEGYKMLQNAIRMGSAPADFMPADHGLVLHAKGRIRRFVVTDPAYRTPSGLPLVISCPDTWEETKQRFDVAYICTVDYRLKDGAGLYYRFFMVNLEHWREIDRAIRELIQYFRRQTQ